MSFFDVPVVQIDRVDDHQNADRLSLIYFREYAVISAKLEDGSHRYQPGQLVVYVPEGAVVPEKLLRMGFWKENEDGTGKGMLAGTQGNIVKAIKLRGTLSQGIMFPVKEDNSLHVYEYYVEAFGGERLSLQCAKLPIVGFNAADALGITKWEAPIPHSMAGDVINIGSQNLPHFDVENMKKYSFVVQEGEDVVITEKLHGTMMGIGYLPDRDDADLWTDADGRGNIFCFSKGLGKQGLVFKRNSDNLAKNVYSKALEAHIEGIRNYLKDVSIPVFIFGEVYGKGVQDLHYGAEKPELRIFDMFAGETSYGVWGQWAGIENVSETAGIDTVPVIYKGPYHPNNRVLKDGKSNLANHIKEGIVIRSATGRKDPRYGRVLFKDVSQDYLLRKNGTEHQ